MNIQIDRHKKNWPKIVTVLLITSLVIVLIPWSVVQANSSPQEETPISSRTEGKGSTFLEKALKREKKVNENLVSLFDKADKVITKLEDAIQNAKTEGKDVSAFEDALKNINNQIASAHTVFAKATSSLSNHAGYNEDGKVTDSKQAADTIREIAKDQREVMRLIRETVMDTLKAIREYRVVKQPG